MPRAVWFGRQASEERLLRDQLARKIVLRLPVVLRDADHIAWRCGARRSPGEHQQMERRDCFGGLCAARVPDLARLAPCASQSVCLTSPISTTPSTCSASQEASSCVAGTWRHLMLSAKTPPSAGGSLLGHTDHTVSPHLMWWVFVCVPFVPSTIARLPSQVVSLAFASHRVFMQGIFESSTTASLPKATAEPIVGTLTSNATHGA
ncbi:hypothetical protein S40288_10545 [Stachybotrys chartarum IBT 40288]|nr:hypothetical protein S40288_10545 [Stachybotrys chartarum IBT 40288]